MKLPDEGSPNVRYARNWAGDGENSLGYTKLYRKILVKNRRKIVTIRGLSFQTEGWTDGQTLAVSIFNIVDGETG